MEHSGLWAGFTSSPQGASKTLNSARDVEVRIHYASCLQGATGNRRSALCRQSRRLSWQDTAATALLASSDLLKAADLLKLARHTGNSLCQQALTENITILQAQLGARKCSPGRQRPDVSPRAANARAEVALLRDALSTSQAHAKSQIQVDMIIPNTFPWS